MYIRGTMKWKYKIIKIIFNNKNSDEYLMKTRMKREYKTYQEYFNERKRLYKHGIKKYGEGTTVALTWRERCLN